MNPPCARCKKTVYPVEKFNCLDKVWHKRCFTCESCNMKLTMNTYKGYNKLPYCKAHYPKIFVGIAREFVMKQLQFAKVATKFTAVADTPEALRLAKQQKNQSEVEYRKDKAESLKGFTQVADSVSNRQASQANRLASAVIYQQQPPQLARQPPSNHFSAPQVPVSQHIATTPHIPPAFSPPAELPPPHQSLAPRFVALYDYVAGDTDEISFVEGDVIVNTIPIDEGWSEGCNSRTGEFGMYPSNYVEAI